MWTTFALRNHTIASPSVWAFGAWKHVMSSPSRWNVTLSLKVTIGSATSGEGGVLRSKMALYCSVLSRLRTLSCATIATPALPKFSFPPVWSPWKWVLKRKRIGLSLIAVIAALILSVSGANSSSITSTHSRPA